MHSLMRWLRGYVASIENDSSLANRNESCQGLERGGLAGPVGPDHADDLATIQAEADAPNHLDPAIGDVEILHLKQSIWFVALSHLRARRSADVGRNDCGIILHGLG